MDNKILIEAPLVLRKLPESARKEIASKLDLPENTQNDLLFMSAILVSTGTNKNGATFLGSELIKARGTVTQKAIDIEHDEKKVIGHITSSMYLDFQGKTVDDSSLYSKLEAASGKEKAALTASLDSMNMDIGIVCIVYRDRFPSIAKEIEAGKWKVSMECYYDDYDLKVGNLIVPRDNAAHFATLDKKVNNDIKLVQAGKSFEAGTVSRVLRGIRFCGVGIVKNPANNRSLILEAASNNSHDTMLKEGFLEAASYNIETDENGLVMINKEKENEVVQVNSVGYYLLKADESSDGIILVPNSYRQSYNEVAKEAIKQTSLHGGKYFIVAANSMLLPRVEVELNVTSEANTYKTNGEGEVTEIHSYTADGSKEVGEVIHYGPADITAEKCVSFEKYLHEFQGRPNPGRILATHWCKLYNKPCPVLGASAKDPSCLRNKYSTLTQDPTDPIVPTEEIPGESNGGVHNSVNSTRTKTGELINNEGTLAIPRTNPNPITDSKTTEELLKEKPQYINDPYYLYKKSDIVLAAPPAPVSVEGEKNPLDNPDESGHNGYTQPRVKDAYVYPDVKKADADKMLTPKAGMKMTDPFKDFPIQMAKLTASERASLDSESFAYPGKKKLAINTPDRVKVAMTIFSKIKAQDTEEEAKVACNRIYNKALTYNLNVEDFEKANDNYLADIDTYGIPSKKLLPLTTKEQVLAAISRVDHLTTVISDREKALMHTNILRAAKKFDIDTTDFRKRINTKEGE
jgi:hypothetical protein